MKREMLIGTRFADVPQIHRVKMPGGDRTQLTFFPDRTGGGHFGPKGDYFTFTKDVGGGEWFQIYRYDLANGRRDAADRRQVTQHRAQLCPQ